MPTFIPKVSCKLHDHLANHGLFRHGDAVDSDIGVTKDRGIKERLLLSPGSDFEGTVPTFDVQISALVEVNISSA